MRKQIHKLVAGMMIGVSIVSMTGCSSSPSENSGLVNENKQNVPMGRYMEENRELPTDIKWISDYLVSDSGMISLYAQSKDSKRLVYTSQDGVTWEMQPVPWLQSLEDEGAMMTKVIQGDNNEVYLLYSMNNEEYQLAKVKEDKLVDVITLEKNEQSSYPQKVRVLENGDVLVGYYYSGVVRYSGVDGSRQVEYFGSEGEFTVAGDRLALMDLQRGGIVVYELETGKEQEVIAYDGVEGESKIVGDQEGNIYAANKSGLSRVTKGGSTWENIIESSMSSFGMPSLYIRDISVKDEQFTVMFDDVGQGAKIVRYTYNPDVPTRPTTELTVYMLEENSTVRQATSEYQSQNPEVLIQLQIGMKPEEAITKSDAIRTLNTELLAGKGPDILILDGLPVDAYADKGVLLDMNEFIGPMIDEQVVLPNIFNAYREDGKIYGVPTRFSLPMMWGDKELLEQANTLEEIAKWGETHKDKKVLYGMTPQMLIEKFYGTSAVNWLDETRQIKEKEFIQFLEAINTLGDNQVDETDKTLIESFSREYMAYSDTQLHLETISSFMGVRMVYSAIEQRGNGKFDVLSNGDKGIYEAHGIIGINANSKNIDTLKDIVKTALSEQVQDIELGDGFPVNAKSLENQVKIANDLQGTMAIMMNLPGGRPVEDKEPEAETYNQIATIAKSVTWPAYEDDVLLQMILEETKGYFDGNKTSEEAAKAVAQRTKAYLAE